MRPQYVAMFTGWIRHRSRRHNESITDGTKVPEAEKGQQKPGILADFEERAPRLLTSAALLPGHIRSVAGFSLLPSASLD